MNLRTIPALFPCGRDRLGRPLPGPIVERFVIAFEASPDWIGVVSLTFEDEAEPDVRHRTHESQ